MITNIIEASLTDHSFAWIYVDVVVVVVELVVVVVVVVVCALSL